jgi:hypothetical protein
LVDTFPEFSGNSFEKLQISACFSSEEFSANLRNVSINRKRAIALSYLQKSFVKKLLVLSGSELINSI